MTLRKSILVFSFSLLLAWKGDAFATPEGVGTQTVRQVNTTLSTTLAGKTTSKKQETKLLKEARSSLGGFLDIEELGQRSLKDHWAKLTEPQRKDFLKLLRDLIETNYVKGLRTNLKYDVIYLGEKSEG